jgi:hypothetical protein
MPASKCAAGALPLSVFSAVNITSPSSGARCVAESLALAWVSWPQQRVRSRVV